MFNILTGIRIIDLTTIVLGPYATQMLGDLGAEVIKVEPIAGDLFRYARPGRSSEMGAHYLNCNRNKKSLAIDLKAEEGNEIFRRLIASTDVVVHNMRDQSTVRLGASYEDLKAIKPDLIYCSAPGFGQTGPNANAPAYDDIIQAASGVAALNKDTDGAPKFLPTILCDKITGLHLVVAVMSGLVHRMQTGKGCAIAAPMFESMVSFLMAEGLSGQTFLPPLGDTGYERLLSPYRKPFKTADGYVSILPYSTKHWVSFLNFVELPEIAQTDWVTDPVKRSDNINRLYKLIAGVTPARTTADWCEALASLDVPCTPVNSLDDLLANDHLEQISFFQEYEHPSEGRLRGAKSPFSMTGVVESPDQPAPNLGENTKNLLREIGFSASEVDDLMQKGIVRGFQKNSRK